MYPSSITTIHNAQRTLNNAKKRRPSGWRFSFATSASIYIPSSFQYHHNAVKVRLL